MRPRWEVTAPRWEDRFTTWDKGGETVTGSRIADVLAGLVALGIIVVPLFS